MFFTKYWVNLSLRKRFVKIQVRLFLMGGRGVEFSKRFIEIQLRLLLIGGDPPWPVINNLLENALRGVRYFVKKHIFYWLILKGFLIIVLDFRSFSSIFTFFEHSTLLAIPMHLMFFIEFQCFFITAVRAISRYKF